MFHVFGQELYLRETVRAAAVVAGEPDRRAACDRIAALLPHPSARTRARVASEIARRLAAGAQSPDLAPSFARLVAGLHSPDARRDLVIHAVARADALVGAIAREVLFPILLDEAMPRGVTSGDMARHGAAPLITVEPIVPFPFLRWFAAERWRFERVRTLHLALRVLRQAGLVHTTRLLGQAGRVQAVALSPHGLSFPAFVWCLADEIGRDQRPLTQDRIARASFARTLLVPASAGAMWLPEAERRGFLRAEGPPSARRYVLAMDPREVAGSLLANAGEG
ncbi:MAG TPA: hypothetical protein VLH79_13335 [Chthonomonadales bacterium]|nr:hypothetical protein [Chthonomonadales bacterium]